ncbi:MAG: PIN domain-containing protein [Solirubrobacteraceae bacterium]
MSGYGRSLLIDPSVWARASDGRLRGDARKRFDAALIASELWTCPPALLEMRYSARDGGEFAEIASELDALAHAQLTAAASTAAVQAQAELAAARGISHRVKPVDLLIAAIASAQAIGVLHYDHDYDTIATHTSLAYESVWVAPRGSLD